MKHAIALFTLVTLGLLVNKPIWADSPAGATEVQGIKIDNFSFTPSSLTVKPGTKVTWTNKDDVPHTVTSVDNKFGSKVLDTDEQFSFTFSVRGIYKYYCKVHPHMTATILVQ